jgi:hypothetical protein
MEAEMRELCDGLKSKVDTFLALQTADTELSALQKQVQIAREVIDEALTRYRFVPSTIPHQSCMPAHATASILY